MASKKKKKLRLPKRRRLYKQQKKDIRFFIKNGGGYDQSKQGTGKSIVAAVWLANIKCEKALVVVPAIMRETFAAEIKKWSKRKFQIEVVDTNTEPDKYGRKLPDPTSDCVIVSYRYIINKRILKPLLKRYGFDALVFDEWHYCKSFKSKRTKCALLLERQAKYTLCLSGTPYNNNVMDLYSQLQPFASEKQIGATYSEFGHKFSKLVDTGFGREFKGIKNTKRLRNIMRKFSRCRRLEDMEDIPPLTIGKIYLDVPESLAKKSLKYVDVVVEKITGQREYVDPELADYISTVRKQLGITKCRGIVEYTQYQLETHDRLILYAYHSDVIKVLQDSLREKGISCRSVYGKIPQSHKQGYIKGFQAGKFQVLILQIRSAIGITLTAANYGIAAELDYSWTAMEQAFKRIHRISQDKPVQIDYICAKKSLDGPMLAALNRKRREAKRLEI